MKDTCFSVGIYTLGCKVNQYESEAIAELFSARGAKVLPPDEICDCYIINTCTVTAESDRKARQFVRRATKKNPLAVILVTGCLTQTNPAEITAIPGVDYVSGNKNKTSVVDAAFDLISKGKKNDSPEVAVSPLDSCFEPMRITRFDRTRAYIKIEDGCENHCAYCAIPAARGPVRSKLPEDVLEEVRALTAGGCREVVLTGIETASYGRDLENYRLADLLAAVDNIPGIGRVRLGSLDPSLMKQPFVDRIAPLSSLAPHFHLSMQSGCDRTLTAMKRKYNTKMAMENMERIRCVMPDVQFTTDMIVGFPGETDEDFLETIEFVKKARFLMIHVFPYSRRRGTAADKMPDQVPESVKHERVTVLSRLAAEIRREILTDLVKRQKPLEVLFETFEDGMVTGHTPEFVEVRVKSDRTLHGEIHTVLPTDTDGNTVMAEMTDFCAKK